MKNLTVSKLIVPLTNSTHEDRFTCAFTRYNETLKTINRPSNHEEIRQKWIEKIALFDTVSQITGATISLFDLVDNRILCFNDKAKILGYDPENFTQDDGVGFMFSNVYEPHRHAVISSQQKMLDCFFEHPFDCVKDIVGNITFKFRRRDGKFIEVIQKTIVVETDDRGKPMLYLRFIFDINHLVNESLSLIINQKNKESAVWNYNLQKKCLESYKIISLQEKKVINLLVFTKESQKIADALFISRHTVNTHRRNLLSKTHCIDVTALIEFARISGLLETVEYAGMVAV